MSKSASLEWLGQMGKDAHLLFHLAQWVSAKTNQIGIAVSGGSDSLALLHLAHQAAPYMGWELHAVTVDHALREGSAAEAAGVAAICADLAMPHQILRWDHGEISGNLQDQARRARYRLIADWAGRQGIGQVWIAHTADDQAETFLMGLARAAGVDGLSGMRRDWVDGGMQFARPLLAQTRAELRDYLKRRGVSWVDDPSNENDRFTRVKARRALKALNPLGITVERLGETIFNLASAQTALRFATADLWRVHGREEAGALYIAQSDFAAAGAELQRRLILAAVQWLAGDFYMPRAVKVETLQHALLQGRDATLQGCRFRLKAGVLSIYREPRAVEGPMATTEIWDGRWQLVGPHDAGLHVAALGAAGLKACPAWRKAGVARDALLVSPAIWRDTVLIAAPLAGFPAGWAAKLSRSLNEVILSH